MNIVIRGNVVGLKPGNLVIAQKFRLFCSFNCAASPNVFQSWMMSYVSGVEQRISCRRYMEWEHILRT